MGQLGLLVSFPSGTGAPGQVGVSGLWCFHAHQMCTRGALRHVPLPQILCLGHTWLGPFLEHPLPNWVFACSLLEQKLEDLQRDLLGDVWPGPHGSIQWGQMGLGDALASHPHLLTAGHRDGPARAWKRGYNAGTGAVRPPMPAGKDTSSTMGCASRQDIAEKELYLT